MNFTHLAAFHAVGSTGSVTAAAEYLHVSQPSLTREIRELEERLGTALFDRVPRGMKLTEAGQMLMQFAAQIFNLADAAENALAEFSGLHRGTLKLAASRTVGTYLLPRPLEAFRSQFPNIEIELVITNTETVALDLLDHKCQLGFIEGVFDSNTFDATLMGHDELVLIAAPSHRLATRKTLTPESLAKEPLFSRESGSGMRAAVEAAYKTRGIKLRSALSLGSAEAIKQTIALGGGLAWMSRYAVQTELNSKALVSLPVKGFEIKREFHMIWLKGRVLAPSSKAFADFALASLEAIRVSC